MIILIGIVVIALLSVLLAVRSVENELSVPQEVTNLRIPRKKPVSGVILFLKEKFVHYSSKSS